MLKKEKECLYCKKIILLWPSQKRIKFCSRKCYFKYRALKTFIKCKYCNKIFKRKKKKAQFCGIKCMGKYLSQIKTPKIKIICRGCNKIFYRSKSYKRMFCSSKCKNNFWIKENHHSWKGGIKKERDRRKSYEAMKWRKTIFNKNNYTCQKCFKKGRYLEPHHIKGFAQYPKLRISINNGITFCKKCHRKFHKIYGTKNNTREQLEEFLNK